MANNYDKLEFEINAKDNASKVLQNIENRLKSIQNLSNKGGGGKAGGSGVSSSKLSIDSPDYKSVRTQELLNKEKKKSIDNEIKLEQGIKSTNSSMAKQVITIAAVVAAGRKLGQVFTAAIKESAAYVENLNLFAVTFGETYQETLDWSLDIASGFGLASNEIVRFTGLFKQLSDSIGIVSETGTEVSKVLTQLGYDKFVA